MRILFSSIFFIICTFIIVSCQGKPDKMNTALIIPESYGVDTIHIDLDTILTDLSFKDFFSKIEVIPLQTTKESSVHYCQKIIVNEGSINNYVLLDAQQILLFSFDSIGNFIRKLPLNIRNSPYEFPHLWLYERGDRLIYNAFDSLYMYYYNGKISMYNNKTLEYIKKRKINLDKFFLSAFFPLNNDIYVFQGVLGKEQNDWGDTICFYSNSGDSLIKGQNIHQKFYSTLQQSFPFEAFNNRVFFKSPIFSNAVYVIDSDSLTVTPFLVVDYGRRTLTESNFDSFYKDVTSQNRKSKNYAYLIDMKQNNKTYWFFSFLDGNIYISIYNKAAKAIQTLSIDFDFSVSLLTDEMLYCVIDANQVQKIINSGILTEENVLRLAKVKPSDNPLILKCYLKVS